MAMDVDHRADAESHQNDAHVPQDILLNAHVLVPEPVMAMDSALVEVEAVQAA